MITATLGGVELLAGGEVGWRFTTGVTPYQRVFVCHRSDLDRLLALRGEDVELEITNDANPPVNFKVKRLSILRQVPTNHPDTAAVLVSDVRWKWKYKWIMRRFNVRRKSGVRRLVSGDQVLEAQQATTDATIYGRFSLLPPDYVNKWTARDVVRVVFGEVTDWTATPIDDHIFDAALDVDDMMIDDNGMGAVSRVMSLLPGVTCRVNEEGITELYSAVDGKEEWIVNDFDGNTFVGATLPEEVSMAYERPSSFVIHYNCEDEVRFNFIEGVTRTVDDTSRYMKNVLPLPVTTTINNVEYAAGTWMEITDTLLLAWYGTYPPTTPMQNIISQSLGPLTLSLLRQAWCNGGWNIYVNAATSSISNDPIWGIIYKCLRDHYRQTFQISEYWVDRVIGFLPRRVSLLDPINMVWGKPSVWTNHAIKPTNRVIGRTDADPTSLAYNRAVFSDTDLSSEIDDISPDSDQLKNKQAQAELSIVDPQLGVFHIDYFLDAYGKTLGIIPSCIEGYDPGLAAGGDGYELASARVDAPLKVETHCRLKSTFGCSIILTCLTGSPNDLGQTWAQPVTYFEAKSVLPESVQKQIFGAYGPEMHIHCEGYNARFAWIHEQRKYITDYILGNVPRGPAASRMLVNDEFLTATAKAMAAKVYSAMVDHYEGEPMGFIPDQTASDTPLLPRGRVTAVDHIVRPDGVVYSRAELPPPRQGLDIWSLMPEFARRYLRRILP